MTSTTPQRFAEQQSRDLLLSILAAHVLQREADPAATAQKWQTVLTDVLMPSLRPPEQEYAEKWFHQVVGQALTHAVQLRQETGL
jgi:hypothetical protein